MAKYHHFQKFVAIKHYFGTKLESTIFYVLKLTKLPFSSETVLNCYKFLKIVVFGHFHPLTFKYIDIDYFYFCATRILIFLFFLFLILWKAFGPFVFRNVCQNKTVWNLIEEIVFLMLMWCFKKKEVNKYWCI